MPAYCGAGLAPSLGCGSRTGYDQLPFVRGVILHRQKHLVHGEKPQFLARPLVLTQGVKLPFSTHFSHIVSPAERVLDLAQHA